MPFSEPDYHPSFFFRNGHSNTILPFLFRGKKQIGFERVTIQTLDLDFIDLDFLKCNSKRCAILVHGLEGSSESAYILTLAKLLQERSWDVAAMNMRSCSGRPNNLYRSYHSGAIEDLDLVVENLQNNYEKIIVIGFSLGGNLVLKYTSEKGDRILPKVKAVVGVSVPCHLSSSSDKMEDWQNYVYSKRFLVSLKQKLKEKMERFPGVVSANQFNGIKNLRDFDDVYTGPANGFVDGEDYYTQSSSAYVISKVAIPTLLVNAQDDPFLTEKCFPIETAKNHPFLELLAPKYGGHVGFWPDKKNGLPKHEEWILAFLAKHNCA